MTDPNEDPHDASQLEIIACRVHELITEASRGDSVPWAYGKKHLGRHGQRRRIVWTRTSSPIEPAQQAGPRPIEFTDANTPGQRATSSWTMRETAHVYIYGESDGARRRMVANVIAAATNAFGPNFVPSKVHWGEDEQKGGGETSRNELAILECSFPVPIVDFVWKLRECEGYRADVGTLQPDGSIKPIDE